MWVNVSMHRSRINLTVNSLNKVIPAKNQLKAMSKVIVQNNQMSAFRSFYHRSSRLRCQHWLTSSILVSVLNSRFQTSHQRFEQKIWTDSMIHCQRKERCTQKQDLNLSHHQESPTAPFSRLRGIDKQGIIIPTPIFF